MRDAPVAARLSLKLDDKQGVHPAGLPAAETKVSAVLLFRGVDSRSVAARTPHFPFRVPPGHQGRDLSTDQSAVNHLLVDLWPCGAASGTVSAGRAGRSAQVMVRPPGEAWLPVLPAEARRRVAWVDASESAR
ncbi:hypothetical protein GCM10023195_81240 [Actinoallomurus liliacearum]|uniref:Uncharacterized protein n=1 Tax=Actinoallomurus liliacearum TaxID=1080073 RepID=A0ABP8U0J8_9ACTN